MVRHRQGLDRIYDHGGVFVCFIAPRIEDDFFFITEEWEIGQRQGHMSLSSWDFLTVLQSVDVSQDRGEEILAEPISEKIPGLKRVLAPIIHQAPSSNAGR
jgi:hypothetical protein